MATAIQLLYRCESTITLPTGDHLCQDVAHAKPTELLQLVSQPSSYGTALLRISLAPSYQGTRCLDHQPAQVCC